MRIFSSCLTAFHLRLFACYQHQLPECPRAVQLTVGASTNPERSRASILRSSEAQTSTAHGLEEDRIISTKLQQLVHMSRGCVLLRIAWTCPGSCINGTCAEVAAVLLSLWLISDKLISSPPSRQPKTITTYLPVS